jgi:hypothetical protein
MKYGRIFLLAAAAVTAVLLGTADVSAVPGDEDNDGLITGPRLVGNTTFRGCFASGPGVGSAQSDTDVDTITDALDATDSWDPANMTELKQGTRAQIEACINAAKGASVAGDEFVFYFSGHGGDDPNRFPDTTESGEGGGADNHIRVGDQRIKDDDLANMLDGFKKSVTIVVILDSCQSHTFKDGVDDLASVTQVNGDAEAAGKRLALIASTSAANGTCGWNFTSKLADGLGKVGDKFKADANGDGVVTAKEAEDYAHDRPAGDTPKCDDDPTECPVEGCGTESTYDGPVPPDIDECPTQWGPVENNGCPPPGGITELLVDGSDGPRSASDGSGISAANVAAIAGGAAAAALAIAAGGWYARRRWLR